MKAEMYLGNGSPWYLDEDVDKYYMAYQAYTKKSNIMGGVDICFEDEGLGERQLNLYDDFRSVMAAMLDIPRALLDKGVTTYQVICWNEPPIPIFLKDGDLYFDDEKVGPVKPVLQACLDLYRKYIRYESKLKDRESGWFDRDLQLISQLEKELELMP